MRMTRERSYWLVIVLLVIALISTLTAWGMQSQQKDEVDSDEQGSCDVADNCNDNGEEQPDEGSDTDQQSDSSDLMAFHPVAIVDGEIITLGDFYRYASTYFGNGILTQMINEQVVKLEAEELGIEVTEEDIAWELKQMQRGYDSEEEFYRVMREQLGMSQEDLIRDVSFRLMLERIATQDIIVTDQEYREYILHRPIEVISGVKLRLQQIIVDSMEEANAVLADLDSGVAFEDLAAAYSDDEMFPNGDLGWIEWNDPFVSQELLEEAKNLELYAWSGPVPLLDGTFGFVKLQGKQELTQEEQEKLEQQIRKEIALGKAQPLDDVLVDLRIKYNASILDSDFR